MTSLAVWWGDQRVATLDERRRKMRCRYLGLDRPMLSVAMVPRSTAYPDRIARPFFHGLLPEGEARRIVAYDLGLGNFGGTDIELLEALGRDCAGALVITGEGETPPDRNDPGPAELLDDATIARRLRALPDQPLGVAASIRVSLPGVQSKLLLHRDQAGGWRSPTGAVPSTHLLKPPSQLFSHSVVNELLCQRFAQLSDVEAAPTDALEFDGVVCLVSTRFDRTWDELGNPSRLHQEDACQALSVPTSSPTAKYQRTRAEPSFRSVARLLDQWGEHDDRDRLLEQMLLAMVVGNADLHGKNLSLIHRGRRVRLSPVYDSVSTVALAGTVSTELAMRVGTATDVNAVRIADVIDEATSWGLRSTHVEAVIDRVLERMPDALGAAANDIDLPGTEPILEVISDRLDRATRRNVPLGT